MVSSYSATIFLKQTNKNSYQKRILLTVEVGESLPQTIKHINMYWQTYITQLPALGLLLFFTLNLRFVNVQKGFSWDFV